MWLSPLRQIFYALKRQLYYKTTDQEEYDLSLIRICGNVGTIK